MSLTYEEARDEMQVMFKTAWDAGAESAGIEVLYADAKKTVPQGNDADNNPLPWARIQILHNLGRQASLSGGLGKVRWQRIGLVMIEIFTPLGTGGVLADRLAKIANDAYEGKKSPGGVWFRDVRLNEVGPSGAWWKNNIIAEFEYDETK